MPENRIEIKFSIEPPTLLELNIRMKSNNRMLGFVRLFLVYIVVKVAHKILGFHYDPFREGLFNVKFLIDIISWLIVSALIYFLMKRLLPEKKNSVL